MTEFITKGDVNQEKSLVKENFKKIISIEIVQMVDKFLPMFRDDGFEHTDERLGDVANKDRLDYSKQLEDLKKFLEEFGKKPNRLHIKVSHYDHNAGYYKLGLGFGQNHSIDQKGEDQVSFLLNNGSRSLQNEDIESASLRGYNPENILDSLDFKSSNSIEIRTNHVYRDDHGRIRTEPKAGISFKIQEVSGKDSVGVYGVRYVGTQPFYSPLNESKLDSSSFNLVERFIVGTTTKPNRKV